MKSLVIVESPTKAKTISKFLGKDYTIRFSMGHIMDLPKSKLGVAIDDNFTPQYEVIGDKKKLIAELKSLAKDADTILLATDPDREGEAISANIKDVLSEKTKSTKKKNGEQKSKFQRIVFHEITEGAIKEALQHPRDIDTNLVDAQTARRVLDRLVGYELSPVLWRKVRRGLSAGRVQSVALRLIVEREREIEKFVKEPYWTIHALLSQMSNTKSQKLDTEFTLVEINSEKIEAAKIFPLYDGEYKVTKTIIDTQEKADTILQDLHGQQFTVADIAKRQMKRSPAAPFTTSTLQQEAARRFGFSGKRTMGLAQKLYEEGFITYHRTDSVILSQVAIGQIREYVEKQYSAKYLANTPRTYTAKQKLAQEAHEAIRPTDVRRQTSEVKDKAGEDYGKLYDIIWRRAVASQMADALIESTTVYVDSKVQNSEFQVNGEVLYRFKATGSVLVFDGFLKLNPQALQDTQLPQFSVGENLQQKQLRADPHQTLPPPRYNDASIISTLEEKGIGRPSTYASIISTLVDRTYVERVEKKFIPTPIGMAVNDFLVANFSTIDDIPFTVTMEDDLDAVANGKKEWVQMMREFYDPFEKKLEEVGEAARVKIETEQTDEKCQVCGNPLVIRHGKFGKFFACSTFPACKFTKPYVEQTDMICPRDGGKIIVKKTKKGRKFFGCSNYPNCTFAVWKLEDIKKEQADENK